MVLALYCDIFKSKSEEIESKNTRVSKLIIKNKNLLETLEYFSNTQEKPKKCLNHVRGQTRQTLSTATCVQKKLSVLFFLCSPPLQSDHDLSLINWGDQSVFPDLQVSQEAIIILIVYVLCGNPLLFRVSWVYWNRIIIH